MYKVVTSNNPSLTFKLKCYLAVCFVLICVDVFLVVLAPRQMGQIVDEKLGSWSSLAIYVVLTFSTSIVHALQRFLWHHAFEAAVVLEQLVLVLLPVLANTVVLTLYALYVYGVSLSIVLFVSTAIHIYCMGTAIEPIVASGGLLCVSLLFGHKVRTCELSAGDFVAFNMYYVQLHSVNRHMICFAY
jgi:hypothetical protein